MSEILETLKFLSSSWLEVAVAVDKRLETQAARIAELEAALATARREGMEEAARIAENEPEPEGEPPIELHGRSVKNIAISSVRATKHSIAAAIRARRALRPAKPRPTFAPSAAEPEPAPLTREEQEARVAEMLAARETTAFKMFAARRDAHAVSAALKIPLWQACVLQGVYRQQNQEAA